MSYENVEFYETAFSCIVSNHYNGVVLPYVVLHGITPQEVKIWIPMLNENTRSQHFPRFRKMVFAYVVGINRELFNKLN